MGRGERWNDWRSRHRRPQQRGRNDADHVPCDKGLLESNGVDPRVGFVAERAPRRLPGLLLFTGFWIQVDACPLLPTADLRLRCATFQSLHATDILDVTLDLLGPETLYLEISSKADAWIRETLAPVGVAALEVSPTFAPQCLDDASFLYPTPESYYSAVVAYFTTTYNRYPENYVSYFVDATMHPYLEVVNFDLVRMGTIIDVPNPFVADTNLTAPVFVGSLFREDPAALLTTDAASHGPPMLYTPALAEWFKLAIYNRTTSNVCRGSLLSPSKAMS